MLSSFLRLSPIKKLIGATIAFGLILLGLVLFRSFVSPQNKVKLEEIFLNNFTDSSQSASQLAALNTSHLNQASPDLMLIEVYKSIASGDFRQAQQKVDELLNVYPNFQLAHLIKGDLITMRTQAGIQFGSTFNPDSSSNSKLKDLHEEALARLKAITERPKEHAIPSNLIQLSKEHQYVLVMDAKRARIYLYQNINGIPSLMSDYYVSQGKLGVDKFKEGDQRTPLGVYFITSRLPGAKLPDLYGPGALPINYPNEWDKRNGRGGSGIWLHGVPSANYSRAPLASDGCIVLSNPDFIHVADTVDKTKTPVIVSNNVNFVTPDQWEVTKKQSMAFIEAWRHDVESKNLNQLIAHYSSRYKGFANETLQEKMNKQHKLYNQVDSITVKISNLYQYEYPGNTRMIVSGFQQEIQSSLGVSNFKNQQYWQNENGQWKIVYEDQSFVSGAPLSPVYVKQKDPVPDEENIRNNPNRNEVAKVEKADSGSSNDQKEVVAAVNNWASAWSKQNMNAYFAQYAKDFTLPSGMSKSAWMDDRRARIEGKKHITVTLESMSVKVKNDTAIVKFRQKYQSGSFNANTRKTLLLIKQNGKWKIKQESTG